MHRGEELLHTFPRKSSLNWAACKVPQEISSQRNVIFSSLLSLIVTHQGNSPLIGGYCSSQFRWTRSHFRQLILWINVTVCPIEAVLYPVRRQLTAAGSGVSNRWAGISFKAEQRRCVHRRLSRKQSSGELYNGGSVWAEPMSASALIWRHGDFPRPPPLNLLCKH